MTITAGDHRELLVLGLLRRSGAHGYRLTDFLEKQLAFLVDLKKPTAYALLERLRQRGFVALATEREGNRPERRVYSVTPAGEARFLALLRENLGGYGPARFPDEVGVYFLDALPADEARALLRGRLAAVEGRLAEYRAKLAGHRGLAVEPVLDHHVAHLETDRAWLARWLAAHEGAGDG